jgi:hypothetical protein
MLWDAVVDLQNRVKKLERKSISEPEKEKEENVNDVKQ